MKKFIVKAVFFLGLIVSFNILSVANVVADGAYGGGGCVPVYGGGVECPRGGEVLIDKKVLNPKSGVFVDNLIPSDPTRYRPQEIVTFQIIVQNTGNQNLGTVTVKDTIPNFLDYMLVEPANNASYDTNSRVLTFTVNNLSGGQKQVFSLKARVVHVAVLPQEKTIVCPVNVVTAETEGRNPDRDESQFCIEKSMEIPAVPSAGPEHFILSFLGLGSSMLAGLKLRKKK